MNITDNPPQKKSLAKNNKNNPTYLIIFQSVVLKVRILKMHLKETLKLVK